MLSYSLAGMPDTHSTVTLLWALLALRQHSHALLSGVVRAVWEPSLPLLLLYTYYLRLPYGYLTTSVQFTYD